jgi:outer membrane autotransporter protein
VRLHLNMVCVGLLGLAVPLGISPSQAQYVINGITETVPGSHATPWVVPGNGTDLVVGNTGTGQLTIVTGGVVTSENTILGAQNGSSGTINIIGAGSVWNTDVAIIGDAGTGQLNIVTGGVVTSAYATLGAQNGSSGTINIIGAGSVWNTNGAMIGDGGAATINITSGGVANSTSSVVLGIFNGVNPFIGTVSGAGSQWLINSNDLYVGAFGTATLNINDGAAVTMGETYLGLSNDGNGVINVTNGSTVQSGDVFLGFNGGANMTGTMNLSGAGTLWAVTGSIEAAYNLGNGFINVTDGAQLTATQSLYLGDCCVLGNSAVMTVSGAGSLAQFGDDVFVGAGVLGTLTVSNGASFVTAGFLHIGNNSEGTVTISGGATVSASGVTIANGGAGTGTLIFGAAANETAVASGTLIAPTVTFGAGDGEIIFNHTSDITFSSILVGNGDISVLSGKTTLNTPGAGYSGDIDISGGTAVINTFLLGNVTVSGSGTLGGSGFIGSLDVENGGTVAPGNSPGSMIVLGNVSFAPGSTYAVEVDGAASDFILAIGQANLTGGTVQVSGAPSLLQYSILIGSGGLTGTFDDVSTSSAFVLYSLSYIGGSVVFLNVDGFNAFTSAALTPNQFIVASVVDQFPSNNPLHSSILASSAAEAQQAFNALAGEILANVGAALASDTHYVREAITGRLIQASYGGLDAGGGQPIMLAVAAPTYVASIDTYAHTPLRADLAAPSEEPASAQKPIHWGRVFGSWGQYGATNNVASMDRNLEGFITGVDGDLGDGWRGGLAIGYMHAGLDVGAGRFSSTEINSYVLGGYAGGSIGNFAIRSGGTWTRSSLDSSRSVVMLNFSELEEASYIADVGQLFGELAYPILTNGSAIEPFAGLAYVHVGTGGFAESGPVAGLTSNGNSMDVGYGTLGVRTSTTVMWDGTRVTPHASLAWQYAFGDTTSEQSLAFVATGVGMDVSGMPLAQHSALLEIGADMLVAQDATFGISYVGQYAEDFIDNGLRCRFNWKF